MNSISEMLDECKKKLNISSTYALSKRLGINESTLSEYYSGKHVAGNFECFKIAETLEIDPAYVIAKIKAESEKNPNKAEYFRSFIGASKKAASSIVLLVLLSFTFLNVSGTQNDFKSLWRVFLKKLHFV